jgi:hypothetical protein
MQRWLMPELELLPSLQGISFSKRNHQVKAKLFFALYWYFTMLSCLKLLCDCEFVEGTTQNDDGGWPIVSPGDGLCCRYICGMVK